MTTRDDGWRTANARGAKSRAVAALTAGQPFGRDHTASSTGRTARMARRTNEKRETEVPVAFGLNRDALSHAFRHTDACGLHRKQVASAIAADLAVRTSWCQPSPGQLLRGFVLAGGRSLAYHAYVLPDGTFNVGRIVPHRPNRR